MNRYLQSLILLFAVTVAISSCKNEGNGNGGENDSLVGDTTAINGEFHPFPHAADKECANLKPYEFCYQGFDFIKLHDTLAWKELKVPGGLVKDTVFNEIQFSMSGPDTISWVVRMVDEGGSRIYLEGDFESSWYLNRARIENPKYVLQPFGVHVGMTLGELKQKFPQLYINALPDFKMVEVFPSANLFFLFDDKGYVGEGQIAELAMVPDNATIKSIVLM